MSLVKYILQSCNGDFKYKVNFTSATSLNVGEIWYVECGGIESGCYEVIEDNGEILDEYNSDECTFIEFEDCDGCETTFGQELKVLSPMRCMCTDSVQTTKEILHLLL